MPLKRRLSDKLTLIKSRQRRLNRRLPPLFTHRVTVGIGGNIGDVARRFNHLQLYLQRDPRFKIIETAPILKNPPFGYLEQDDFLNSVIVMKTPLNPYEVLRFLLRTEKHFGRKRSFANAPRTLDLDIIFFDNVKINTPTLQLPHPHWSERESVVIPMHYMRQYARKNGHG
ncbi:MAG: 2-amino-4-hydroxy-6-hydroxymethyldihydropteridine diphosphokinase [Epsilonproteobacteria bacterium]|nr:MAG: 2-amino-4-hydroxy-6-hydroxymethyldihydropteridine diphosphokinase [Campylobacterota bacterium]